MKPLGPWLIHTCKNPFHIKISQHTQDVTEWISIIHTYRYYHLITSKIPKWKPLRILRLIWNLITCKWRPFVSNEANYLRVWLDWVVLCFRAKHKVVGWLRRWNELERAWKNLSIHTLTYNTSILNALPLISIEAYTYKGKHSHYIKLVWKRSSNIYFALDLRLWA
jgi:hypothetical protein